MRIDRVTPDDVISLATDVGPVPMQVAGLLRLGGPVSREQVCERVVERLTLVPRLRQRLLFPPFGAGRPVWVDDPGFDVDAHVSAAECPMPGDDEALLAVAAGAVTRRLPFERPLWRMVLVPGLASGGCALVVVFHHVLADGIGGLAVLANLVDGPAPPPMRAERFPQPPPAPRALYADAGHQRLRALRDLGQALRRARAAVGALRPQGRRVRASATSLNRATGARRHLAVVRADLAAVRRAGHAHHATVNDVVLAAVAGAAGRLLAERGERLEEVVVSVPVSARTEAAGTSLGNDVGVVPVAVPTGGAPPARLEQVAATTRAAKSAPRTTSAAALGPLFRLLARLGIFQWFVDRQRLVHTFVTNLHGPDTPLRFAGEPITELVAVAPITGNVTASFAVLSYAGSLTVTVIADPVACPDHARLADLLGEELGGFCSTYPAGAP